MALGLHRGQGRGEAPWALLLGSRPSRARPGLLWAWVWVRA